MALPTSLGEAQRLRLLLLPIQGKSRTNLFQSFPARIESDTSLYQPQGIRPSRDLSWSLGGFGVWGRFKIINTGHPKDCLDGGSEVRRDYMDCSLRGKKWPVFKKKERKEENKPVL